MLYGLILPLVLLGLSAGMGILLWVYSIFRPAPWTTGQVLRGALVGTVLVIMLLAGWVWLNLKVTLDKEDIYGTYRVDPDLYPGPQADWQRDHYNLTIAEDGTIALRERYDNGGNQTFSGRYEFKEGYASAPRLRIPNDVYIHHIVSDSPTLYRERWGFYYVFRSHRYGNMFFRKVGWWEG